MSKKISVYFTSSVTNAVVEGDILEFFPSSRNNMEDRAVVVITSKGDNQYIYGCIRVIPLRNLVCKRVVYN